MSTLTVSTDEKDRPSTVTGAISLLLVAVALTAPAVILTMDGFDAAFIAIAATLASLKLAGAIGLLRCRRWAMIVGFSATLVDVLLCALTLSDSPSGADIVASIAFIGIGLATLGLLALPSSRRSYV
ncbi:MAG: hypothetical protein WBW04_17680 [Nitrolancea sp.]